MNEEYIKKLTKLTEKLETESECLITSDIQNYIDVYVKIKYLAGYVESLKVNK